MSSPSSVLGLLLSFVLLNGFTSLTLASYHNGGGGGDGGSNPPPSGGTSDGHEGLPSNFYESVGKFVAESDELNSLKAAIDAYPAVKAAFKAESNGTVLAPTDAAFGKLLEAVGYGPDGQKLGSVGELVSIQALKDDVEEMLKMHFLTGPYPDSMYHTWWAAGNDVSDVSTMHGSVTLYLEVTSNDDYHIYLSPRQQGDSPAAVVQEVDLTELRTNDTNFGSADKDHQGHVHTIDNVLHQPMKFNFAGDIGGNADLTTLQSAVMTSDVAKYAVLGPALKGAVVAPTNTAFENFATNLGVDLNKFLENETKVKRVLYEHIINSQAVENSTTDYTTLKSGGVGSGSTVTVQFNDDGAVTGLTNGQDSANVTASIGTNFQGGWVYVIDAVVASAGTKEFLTSLASPANGNWKKAIVLPEKVDTADAEKADELLSAAGLGVMDSDDQQFNFWLLKRSALTGLLSQLDITEDDLKSRPDELKELLNSYRVSSDKYANDGGMLVDKFYETENPAVELAKTSDTKITVKDAGSGRKLFSAHTASGAGSDAITFDDGKTLYYLDSAPVTETMASLSGASQVIPSSFALVTMLIAAIVAMLGM